MKKTEAQKIQLELMARRNSALQLKCQKMDRCIYVLHKIETSPKESKEYVDALTEYYQLEKYIDYLDKEYSIWNKAVIIVEDIINGEE